MAESEGLALMSRAPDIGAADQELYDREVPTADELVSRFLIPPGVDGLLRLHTWLDDLNGRGTIVAWYDGGAISDAAGTGALVEFETMLDREKALALWPRK